jgi:MOSC domain-containing protein YiiM
MWQGEVTAIHLHAKRRGQPLQAVGEVRAVAGCGLEGDSFFRPGGLALPDKEVTLIAVEALAALEREFGVTLTACQSRRNIATRGVPLNELVGRSFCVGEAVLEGMRLCEPCSHLAALTQPSVLSGLAGRGGLRARITRGGLVRVGDIVRPANLEH